MADLGDAVEPVATMHATALVVADIGVLIRGASGGGKTRIAEALVGDARRAGRFGRLVADDRVVLTATGGRLVARPHPRGAGFVERRGVGIVRTDHEPACVIRLLVELTAPDRLERVPDPADRCATLFGVTLPRLALPAGTPASDAVYRIGDELVATWPRLWK